MADEPEIEEQEEYFEYEPHKDIEAAYNALLSIEDIDLKLYGDKDLKKRIFSNALTIIDKALQYIAEGYEEEED